MIDCLIFNHHSLPFGNYTKADQEVPIFLKICLESKNAGLKTIFVDEKLDKTWFRVKLAPNYYWQDWYNKHKDGEQRDYIQAFRLIATKTPFFSVNDISEDADLFDVYFNDSRDFLAVKAAVWHEAPLVSFAAHEVWIKSPLVAVVRKIHNETAQIVENQESIHNFYSWEICQEVLSAIQTERIKAIQSGKEMFQNCGNIFPNLVFCGKCPQQLRSWSTSSTILDQVKKGLYFLNEFGDQWKLGKIISYNNNILRDLGLPFQVSGESETVRTNHKLKEKRMFWLPEGRKEFFGEHIKLSNGYRLHFYPDKDTKQIYVGYIGPHLPL